MATYLVSWDPTKWDWRSIKDQSDQAKRGAPIERTWSCGSARRIFNGDVVYFLRQGREPRGLFARGVVTRGSYEATNPDVQDANRGRPTLVIDIKFTELVNGSTEVVVPRPLLKGGLLGKFVWDIRESGVKIPEDVATQLENVWFKQIPKFGYSTDMAARPKATEARAKSEKTQPPPEEAPAVKSKAQPAATPAGVTDAEREKLKADREARLARMKMRDKKKPEPVEPEPEPISEDERNRILVENYFVMLDAELQGELYSKADHRNRISKETGLNDESAIDALQQDISAVLAEAGLPFADAFPPQKAPSPKIEKAVHIFIEENPEIVEALWLDPEDAGKSVPVELDEPKLRWKKVPEASGFRPRKLEGWQPAAVADVDFRLREHRATQLSSAGERFVLAFERARLRELGLKDKAKGVMWQTQTFGESFGYDILSFNDDGSDRLICVKTTNYGPYFPFTLLQREIELAESHPENFYLYRVFQFSRGARLFILNGREMLTKFKEPVAFRFWS
ncbi:MAG: DUF3883 domain-containing protein [Gammaproteobacteria bacterium]|nr:DUF3883 domain-containing protein [Gammaproteobacteria bacterium]